MTAETLERRDPRPARVSLPAAGAGLVLATLGLFVLALWLTDGAPLRPPVALPLAAPLTLTAERG